MRPVRRVRWRGAPTPRPGFIFTSYLTAPLSLPRLRDTMTRCLTARRERLKLRRNVTAPATSNLPVRRLWVLDEVCRIQPFTGRTAVLGMRQGNAAAASAAGTDRALPSARAVSHVQLPLPHLSANPGVLCQQPARRCLRLPGLPLRRSRRMVRAMRARSETTQMGRCGTQAEPQAKRAKRGSRHGFRGVRRLGVTLLRRPLAPSKQVAGRSEAEGRGHRGRASSH